MSQYSPCLKRALLTLPALAVLFLPTAASAADYQFRVHSKGVRALLPAALPQIPAAGLALEDQAGNAVPQLEFADTAVGSNSPAMSLVLRNTGDADLEFESPPLSVAAPFSVTATTCAGTLAPTETCSVSLVFSPTAAQVYSGENYALSVHSNVTTSPLPLTGAGTMVGVARVVTSSLSHSTFVLRTDGSWVATGRNSEGQLGLGSYSSQPRFVPVPGLAGADVVVLGDRHTFVKFADGSWGAAGDNTQGQLGIGNTSNSSTNPNTFVAVPALAGATQVVLGTNHTLAQLANGSWVGAGLQTQGQLGTGTHGQQPNFVTLTALAGARQVYAGSHHTYAQLSNGQWVASGYNERGQLGVGNTSNRYSFTSVPSLTGAIRLVPTHYGAFAQMSDGTWRAAGYNANGQFGLGDMNNRNTFVNVPALAGARQVAAGITHTFAQLSTGQWVASGDNQFGQLGLGNTTSQVRFVSVPGLAGAIQVISGQSHAFAEMSQGTWAGGGYNGHGELGLGDATHRSTFTLVPALNGASVNE